MADRRRRIGHRPVRVPPTHWECKCGAFLADRQRAVADAMRVHRAAVLAAEDDAGVRRKTCEGCGAAFTRPADVGDEQWEARRFCGQACGHAGRRGVRRVPDAARKSRYRTVKIDGVSRLEHRVVMEGVVGRPLLSSEQVHHRNEMKLDNRPENLEVVTAAEHGERHTRHPVMKTCVICEASYTPHKTKRVRQQTCGRRACWSALQSLRARERLGLPPRPPGERLRAVLDR